jgi:hypothetical protein
VAQRKAGKEKRKIRISSPLPHQKNRKHPKVVEWIIRIVIRGIWKQQDRKEKEEHNAGDEHQTNKLGNAT